MLPHFLNNHLCKNILADMLIITFAPVTPIRAQKLLMDSAGNPRRLRAANVKRRGSSQSLQIPANEVRGIIRELLQNMITTKIILTGRNEFPYFPLANDSVTDVEPPVLPLHGTIDL